jgi:sulfite reductase beta subunit-like hemoprotein
MPNIYKQQYRLKLEREHMSQNLLKTMNATIVTGEYTDRQTGQQKKSYLTIGKLFVYNDGGMSLKLDAMPTGNQNIIFYDIKPKNQNNNNQPNQQNQSYNSNGQQQNNQNNQNNQ